MSNQGYFIGIGAGFVAALVFVSTMTGPLPIRFLLFLLTPLPLFMAGLGWGYLSALVGALTGGVILTLLSNISVGGTFALTQALPAVVLSYLALLNRPIAPQQAPDNNQATPSAPQVEWYPIGRLVVWTAVLAFAIAVYLLILLGSDMDTLKAAVRDNIANLLKSQLPQDAGAAAPDAKDIEELTNMWMRMLPAVMGSSVMAYLLFNLWLSARITLASGQLRRPWPDLPSIIYPPLAALVFALAVAASFLPGMPGVISTALAGAFYFAFLLLGLAVLHHITRGKTWRPFALGAAYVVLLTNGVLIALVGLVEPISPIKRWKSKPSPPPNNGPPSGTPNDGS